MVRFNVRIIQKPNLLGALPGLSKDSDVDAQVRAAAQEVQALAQVRAPRDPTRPPKEDAPVTGRLRNSVEAKKVKDKVHSVGTNVPYAAFQEFGTGRAGRASAGDPVPDTYAHGPKQGIPARPFLRPALATVQRALRRGWRTK